MQQRLVAGEVQRYFPDTPPVNRWYWSPTTSAQESKEEIPQKTISPLTPKTPEKETSNNISPQYPTTTHQQALNWPQDQKIRK